MISKFQVLLAAAALAIVSISIVSLYGDDDSAPAATPVPVAEQTTPALAPTATALPAPGTAPVSAVEAPTIMPGTPVPLPKKTTKAASPTPGNRPMLPPATFTDKNDETDDVKIFSLVNAQAATMADQLRQLVPNVAVVADERTNSILIRGPKSEALVAEALVSKLDSTSNFAEPRPSRDSCPFVRQPIRSRRPVSVGRAAEIANESSGRGRRDWCCETGE